MFYEGITIKIIERKLFSFIECVTNITTGSNFHIPGGVSLSVYQSVTTSSKKSLVKGISMN